MRRDHATSFNDFAQQQSALSAGFYRPLGTDWSQGMTNHVSGSGYGSGSAPTILVNITMEGHIAVPAPAVRKSCSRRARATMTQQTPTASLVIPVRKEPRNIAWVLEQITDDVDEIVLVDGNSTDATLITACRYRPADFFAAHSRRETG
jgi:hypothetical protein